MRASLVLCVAIAINVVVSYTLKPVVVPRTQMSQRGSQKMPMVSTAAGEADRAPSMQQQRLTPEETAARLREFQGLLREMLQIVASTGFEAGLKRSLSVARASNVLTREVAGNVGEFLTEDGRGLNLPRLLRRLFEELGATYIKLGQFIASSPTLFPPEYVLEFQACLDNSPVVSFEQIKRIIESDLGKPLSQVFSYVDEKPLASASIAQVHRATLKDGNKDVVIKVRKPASEETLKADLGFLLITSKLLEFVNPSLSRLSLANIVGDIRESMLDELDFSKEAANLREFRDFLTRQGMQGACAPEPFLATKKVLVMEYLKGVPLVDLEGIKEYSDNPEQTLITALQTWAASVVDNESFHADLHGGNILVLEDGKVGFIDFGIVGRIPTSTWNALDGLLGSFALKDYRGVATSLVSIGATDDKIEVDVDRFGRELEGVVESILAMETNIDIVTDVEGRSVAASLSVDDTETTRVVLEIVRVAEDNGIRLPREFGILIKQALYFDRYQKLLAPTLDPLRDDRVRASLSSSSPPPIIDAEIVE